MQKTALGEETMDTETQQTLINLGKTLSPEQFTLFLNEAAEHGEKEQELSYILVGLSPQVFSGSLRQLSPPLISLLQQEGLQEPLHYLLTQVFHEGEILYKNIRREIGTFDKSLAALNLELLFPDAIQELLNRIEEYRDSVTSFLPTLNHALALIWHTNRIDLIEKLSSLKEILLQLLTYAIGSKGNDGIASTGLYASLENCCAKIYDPSLADSDAAIEGLTRLSIWFYRDYLDLGLPLIEQEEEREKGRMTREDLLSQTQKLLERLNIGTVKGLKQAYIFSKEMLKRYIETHKHVLFPPEN